MRNQVKIKTTTKSPTLRYFYALIAFVLKNVWVVIQRRYFSVRDNRVIVEENKFRFQQFKIMVWDAIRERFQPITEIYIRDGWNDEANN
ncbi:hypothetical protein [Methanorbis rubei]|uniref:hypothetical protein n=1 Tax=Methanorbis rubei TaxID=3028300 RepID=UPI0030B8E671